jgi:beta-glucosidase
LKKKKNRILPYKDYRLPTAKRIRDLISLMSVEEKLSQLMNESPAIPGLGIPEYNWWSEGLHGVARAGFATVFPQAIGLAATFDKNLMLRVATAISDEARAKHHQALKENNRKMYFGLTFWSPNINIFRDPRWGRGQETYGEDPFLTSRMAVEFIKGMQGNDKKYLKTAACAKHFAVHSGPEADRHSFNAVVSEKDLRETYLPAFKASVQEANVEAVMGAYNRTNNEPCCASKKLMVDILRGEWKFKGHYVSDCGAIRDIYEGHKYSKTAAEAAALSTKMGCDLNCCLWSKYCSEAGTSVQKAYKYGLIDERTIDISLSRLLATRFKLGMFDPPEQVKYSKIPYSVNDCKEHRDLSLLAAQESIVLLKNQGNFLPLDRKKTRSIAVIGPNADSMEALLGNYNGFPSKATTVLDGIRNIAGKNTRVDYIKGCNISDRNYDNFESVVDIVKRCDAVIAVMGLSAEFEGEEGCGGDKKDLLLPGIQNEVIERISSLGKPIILVILSGSSVVFNDKDKNIKAVLEAWYPGEEGGQAVADVILGKYNPGARLPVTFYKSTDDLPDFKDYKMKGRTYRYFKGEPFYAFGFGLSYTVFKYANLKLNAKEVKKGRSLSLSVEVRNAGKIAGDEVVQVYLKRTAAPVDLPLKQLVGFERIHLKPGMKKKVNFTITPEQMSYYNNDGRLMLEPGGFVLYAGGVQPGYEDAAKNTEVLKAQFKLE